MGEEYVVFDVFAFACSFCSEEVGGCDADVVPSFACWGVVKGCEEACCPCWVGEVVVGEVVGLVAVATLYFGLDAGRLVLDTGVGGDVECDAGFVEVHLRGLWVATDSVDAWDVDLDGEVLLVRRCVVRGISYRCGEVVVFSLDFLGDVTSELDGFGGDVVGVVVELCVLEGLVATRCV